ncbi:MAG: glycosyltransferase [Syntrophobacteraceae bacterium]
MNCSRIVFWQEMPSPHQAPWIRALASLLPDRQVIGVFQKDVAPFRLAMGWSQPDYGQAQVFISPGRSTIEALLHSDCERTVHVFSGIVHNSVLDAAFRQVLSSRARVGILSEGRDWRGAKGMLRQAHSFFHERSYRRRVDFILALGRVGTRWFTKCGYDPAKLFPFCYVVEDHRGTDNQSHTKGVSITSVGRLISLKRIDLLLKAVAKVSSPEWTLKIIGEGEQHPFLEEMAERFRLQKKVVFRGSMPNLQVRQELALADIFVFTSRADGWGAVVNEALMSGVPVICSDYCGAADLIHSGFNGELFRCDSLESLTDTLQKWISKGPLSDAKREEIRSWSRCIEGEAVARYFLEIIGYFENGGGRRPRAPWITHQ